MLFKDLPSLPPLRRVSGSIRVEIEEEEKLLSIPEFEALTNFAFVPQLDFGDRKTLQRLAARTEQLHKRGEFTRHQLWLGSYYRKEIESLFLPDIIFRWIDPDIGWGVFAHRPFKKREFIGEYCGKVRKRRREDRKNAYCFEYAAAAGVPTPYIIDAQNQGGIARFINHSDTPNLLSTLATFDRISHIILLANEPIPKGAQLLYDYGPDYWSTRKRPQHLDSLKQIG